MTKLTTRNTGLATLAEYEQCLDPVSYTHLIWELQDKALVKLRVALNRYILQQEINRQQHFDQ